MLHEIFKGMDNAAEQINENFQNGSIVESGNNENGFWARYGDGTQMCILERTETLSTTTSLSLFRGNLGNWEFPKAFLDEPYVDVSVAEGSVIGNTPFRLTAEDYTPRIYTIQQTNTSVNSRLIAIGRWK